MITNEDLIRKQRRRRARNRAYLHSAIVMLLILAAGFVGGCLVGQAMQDDPSPSVITLQIIPPPEQEAVQEPEATQEKPAYTERDLELMALVIYQEAGGDDCSDETRLMVGNVVMNRVADSRYPDTIAEVLTERAQYGRLHWTGLEWPERASQEAEAHAVERAYACAERVLEGERLLAADVIYQSEYIQGDEIVAQQDGFYFCR